MFTPRHSLKVSNVSILNVELLRQQAVEYHQQQQHYRPQRGGGRGAIPRVVRRGAGELEEVAGRRQLPGAAHQGRLEGRGAVPRTSRDDVNVGLPQQQQRSAQGGDLYPGHLVLHRGHQETKWGAALPRGHVSRDADLRTTRVQVGLGILCSHRSHKLTLEASQ